MVTAAEHPHSLTPGDSPDREGTLLGLIRDGNQLGVAKLLVAATEPERLALGKPVEAALKAMTSEDWWRPEHNPSGAYAVAILGTAPSAARAAALLNRRELRDRWSRIALPQAHAVVRARELPWLGDLAQRLAARLPARDRWSSNWPLVAVLLAESDGTPPVTEGVVRGWLRATRSRGDAADFAGRLRESPYLDLLLPALFEIDGMGADLNVGSFDRKANAWTNTPGFPGAVAILIAEGRLERKTILDLTVDRLARGDRPAMLRPFVLLYETLAPEVPELSGHTLDYARLLPEAPSTVAGLAQRALRALDDAGLLELDTLLDASRPTLVRKEKTLVKAQLSWLDRVAGREPARVGEVAETIAAAFGHPGLDIQGRALDLIERRISGLDAGTLTRMADAAVELGGDLPARAATLFGTDLPPAPEPVVALPPPPGPAEMPAPIASTAELAEEIVALLLDQTAVRWERVLAGLVAMRGADDMSALRHVLDRYSGALGDYPWSPLMAELGSAIRAVAEAPEHPGPRREAPVTLVGAGLTVETPARLLKLRIDELAALIAGNPVGELLATPTHVNGNLDAAVLVERLRRAEAQGWQPWPLDLEQALLRVPRGTEASVADGLTSEAGRHLRAWLSEGGLADPISTRQDQAHRSGTGRIVVNLVPSRPGRHAIDDQLLTLDRGDTWRYDTHWIHHMDILTATMPHHRETTAAWTLPQLAGLTLWAGGDSTPVLPLLAECDGPFGPAMSLAMAYALGAQQETDRVSAVDAFLTLAAGADPFAAQVGADLAVLATRGIVKVSRVVAPLTDAHRSGATAAVWELLLALLPPLLPAAPRGLPDLLELASQVAAALGAHDEIPGLAALAEKKGTSRLLQESRRLHSLLTAPRP